MHAQGRLEGPEGAARRLSGSHRTQVLSAAAKVKGCGLRLLAAASCPPLRSGTEVKKVVSDLRFFSVIATLPGHDTSLKKLLQHATIPSGSSSCIFTGRVPKLKEFLLLYFTFHLFLSKFAFTLKRPPWDRV